MKISTYVKASGTNLDAIVENAKAPLDTFFGNNTWTITNVNASPLVTPIGSHSPAIWDATVTAEGERA